MAKNIHAIPTTLYKDDLPDGYECYLYVGRMTGELKPTRPNSNISEFSFEMVDADDPTEMVLQMSVIRDPGEQLARWENVGDAVGIVVAFKGKEMFILEAYNFTRSKWFATGYYPHRQNKSFLGNVSLYKLDKLSMPVIIISAPLIVCMGIGLIPLGAMLWVFSIKSKQCKIVSQPDCRWVTGKKIADWITANAAYLAGSANASSDPSL